MSKEKEDTKNTGQKVPWITKFIFWIAFAALLATSIPHVAWVYQTYEPHATTALNLWFFSVSPVDLTTYGIAIGIDVMAAWLTYTITLGGKKGNKSLWLFVGVLVAFSWYCNYLYAMGHNPNFTGDIWNMGLPFGQSTGSITPVLISAVPVLVIAYTVMWEQIGKTGVEDPSVLAAKAVTLEKVNLEKKRIRAAKRQDRLDSIGGLLSDVKQVVTLVSTKDKAEGEAPTEVSISEVPEEEERHTDAIPVTPIKSIEAPKVEALDLQDFQEITAPLEAVKASNGHSGFVPPYRRKTV